MVKVQNLVEPLSAIQPAVASKSNLVILSCVKVVAENDVMHLTASNTEMEISTSLPCETKQPFSACIDAAKFSQFTKVAGDNIIDLKQDGDKAILKAKSRSTIATMPVENFPGMVLDMKDSVQVTIQASELQRSLSITASAVAVHDARYYLTGFYIAIKSGKLSIVASDGCRLSQSAIDVISTGDIEAIIPRMTGVTIAKLFTDGEITLTISRQSLAIDDGVTKLVGKLIDAKYPSFDKIFSLALENAEVSKSDLLKGIEAVMLSANEFRGVNLDFDNDKLKISANNSAGESSEIEIDCKFRSKFSISCKADYLIDAVKKIEGAIIIGLHEYCIIIPGSGDDIHVVMPIRT